MTKEQLQRKFDELTVELKEMNSSDRSYQRVWDVIDPWHSECFLDTAFLTESDLESVLNK